MRGTITVRLALILAGVALLAIVVWLILRGPAESAALWFSGISTLAAVGAVVWAVLDTHRERGLLREQQEQDRLDRAADLDRRHRSQAEQVAAVIEVKWEVISEPGGGFSVPQLRNVDYAVAKVINASHLPIYEIQVALRRGEQVWSKNGPKSIPPTGSVDVKLPPRSNLKKAGHPVEVHFRDNAGTHWVRDKDGDLHEKSRPKAAPEVDSGSQL